MLAGERRLAIRWISPSEQDQNQSRMEENQNPELGTDSPVKREEPDSASVTSDKQVSVHAAS